MPIKHAAIKHLRQTKKRTGHNKLVKKILKTQIKALRKAISLKDKTKAKEELKKAIGLLDKAAQKKIIRKNTAARLKSRLSKQLNSLAKS